MIYPSIAKNGTNAMAFLFGRNTQHRFSTCHFVDCAVNR